jgi:tRNA threonylcarbamoyladenosine modification (KEOPS) complex  Pcc1 subunit
MDYTANVFAKGDPEKLFRCISTEDTNFDRSSFKVIKKDDGVEFDIIAKDAVALRATLNSISQLLIVFEGAGKLKRKDTKQNG